MRGLWDQPKDSTGHAAETSSMLSAMNGPGKGSQPEATSPLVFWVPEGEQFILNRLFSRRSPMLWKVLLNYVWRANSPPQRVFPGSEGTLGWSWAMLVLWDNQSLSHGVHWELRPYCDGQTQDNGQSPRPLQASRWWAQGAPSHVFFFLSCLNENRPFFWGGFMCHKVGGDIWAVAKVNSLSGG